MAVYYRQRRSTYANYRYRNPNQASFIAPEGKVANFMQLDDLMGMGGEYLGKAASGLGNAWNYVRGAGGDVVGGAINAGQSLRGNMPAGVLDEAGNVVQGFVKNPDAPGFWGRVKGVGQDLLGYSQAHPGKVGVDAGVAAGGAAAGAGVFAGARGLLGRLMQRKAAVQQAAVQQAAPRLSTAQKAAIGVGGAGVLGGAAYLATRPGEQRQY